jgi:uncharacterized membrane protein SpoIIM required for sporulation
LAAKIYLGIYQNRKEETNRLLRFWKEDVPSAMARNFKFLLFALFLFILFYLVGFFSSKLDPELIRAVMGDDYVNTTEQNIENGNPFGIYQDGNPFFMWIAIMLNNIIVSFIFFIKGIFLGIGSIDALVSTAIDVGVFHYMFAAKGHGVDFLFAVMLHGLLELTAIVITCGAGMIMGTSFLFPGTLSRMMAFRNGVKDGIKILIGLIPVFIVAAFYEGYITRHYKMPLVLNLILLLPSAAFIVWYFILLPLKSHQQMKKEEQTS